MSVMQTVEPATDFARSKAAAALTLAFVPLSLAAVTAGVVTAALVSWLVWSHVPQAPPSSLGLHLRFGIGAAVLVAFFTVIRNEHRLTYHAAAENTPARTLRVWNMAFAALFVMAFLTRRADELSRGTVVLFYLSGFLAVWLCRSMTTRAVQAATRRHVVAAAHLLVVGTRDEIATFLTRHQPWSIGFEVAGIVTIENAGSGDAEARDRKIAQAVELVRDLAVTDVYLAMPWSRTQTIEACVEAFLTTPVAIHLAPERILDRFDRLSIARVGAMASLELTRPMSGAANVAKRIFDVTAAALALFGLLPLLALVSLAVKIDSPGPVFFLQTRYGFNQRRFRIVKFRTMTSVEDGPEVVQAARDDPRVTRVGRLLRASNLDELPQLLNVLAGDMSLVGPRPHAVPHNRAYERRIALYARRHNVRPGITGWAQVNGLRGETDTDDKMENRVEHDLFYIDNWSMLFDLRILLRTVLSARAYRNAY